MKIIKLLILILIAISLLSLFRIINFPQILQLQRAIPQQPNKECLYTQWSCGGGIVMNNYIQRKGSNLVDNLDILKFISYNVPNYFYVEDFTEYFYPIKYRGRYATEYEQRDILCSIQQSGGQVLRTYVLPAGNTDYHLIYYDGSDPKSFRLNIFLPNGNLNPGFDSLFRGIYLAEKYNIRLIIPLLDWWGYPFWGGLGNNPGGEKTLPNIIKDKIANNYFKKQVLGPLMNTKNSYSNRLLKDEPAVLAWESGNELGNPQLKMILEGKCGGDVEPYLIEPELIQWTQDIASFLKQDVQIKQLLMDGTYGIRASALNDSNIDIVSDHFYEAPCLNSEKLKKNIEFLKQSSYQKPFLIGEHGSQSSKWLLDFLAEASSQIQVQDNKVSGYMLWSLRFRNYDYFVNKNQTVNSSSHGFYCHEEGSQKLISNFHWPGNQLTNLQQNIMLNLQLTAFQITQPYCNYNITNNPNFYFLPGFNSFFQQNIFQAKIISNSTQNSLQWLGATGTRNYQVKYKENSTSDWKVLQELNQEIDSCWPENPNQIFIDKPGSYRVTAQNFNQTIYSNIVQYI